VVGGAQLGARAQVDLRGCGIERLALGDREVLGERACDGARGLVGDAERVRRGPVPAVRPDLEAVLDRDRARREADVRAGSSPRR
jgi:hypothetical protein